MKDRAGENINYLVYFQFQNIQGWNKNTFLDIMIYFIRKLGVPPPRHTFSRIWCPPTTGTSSNVRIKNLSNFWQKCRHVSKTFTYQKPYWLSPIIPFVLEMCVNVQSPLWSGGSSRALSMQTVIKVMNSPQLPRKGRHYQDKKNILRHLSWFAPPPSFYNSTLPELRTILPFTQKNQGSVIYNWTSCILVNPLQWKETLKSFFYFWRGEMSRGRGWWQLWGSTPDLSTRLSITAEAAQTLDGNGWWW